MREKIYIDNIPTPFRRDKHLYHLFVLEKDGSKPLYRLIGIFNLKSDTLRELEYLRKYFGKTAEVFTIAS